MAETMSRQRQASALWAVPIPLVLFAMVGGGYAYAALPFWFIWSALLMLGWLPLVLLLHVRGLRRVVLGLAVAGTLWCLPMLAVAALLPEGTHGDMGQAVDLFRQNVLVGGGIGLLIGGLVTLVDYRRRRRPPWLPALPLATALAGVSLYWLAYPLGVSRILAP